MKFFVSTTFFEKSKAKKNAAKSKLPYRGLQYDVGAGCPRFRESTDFKYKTKHWVAPCMKLGTFSNFFFRKNLGNTFLKTFSPKLSSQMSQIKFLIFKTLCTTHFTGKFRCHYEHFLDLVFHVSSVL